MKSKADSGALARKYIVPPFSILDSRQGYWTKRKRLWKKYIHSENGRNDGLLGKSLAVLAKKHGNNLTGTSIFDPVLTEFAIHWFCPQNGRIIDPFAGGSVRGIVSSFLGNEYFGVDLSERQIEANYANFAEVQHMKDIHGNLLKSPKWFVGDSRNIDGVASGKFDFLLTCPPYHDLEIYSDDERDLSNMNYDEFVIAYNDIIKKSCNLLKDDSFAVVVIGEIRDKKGIYRNFKNDTITAFQNAGLKFYNDCVFVEQAGTAVLRAGRQFNASRKVVKTHQNVLVFLKGDMKNTIEKLELREYDIENILSA